jgi:Ca2+-binding RTX toxin-like protein
MTDISYGAGSGEAAGFGSGGFSGSIAEQYVCRVGTAAAFTSVLGIGFVTGGLGWVAGASALTALTGYCLNSGAYFSDPDVTMSSRDIYTAGVAGGHVNLSQGADDYNSITTATGIRVSYNEETHTGRIIGTAADDRLEGDAFRNNSLSGGGGDDILYGKNHRDVLSGGAGNDRLIAGQDADALHGGAGSNVMSGQGGSDDFHFAAGSSNRVTDMTFQDDVFGFGVVSSFRETYRGGHWELDSATAGDDVLVFTGAKLSSASHLKMANVREIVDVMIHDDANSFAEMTAMAHDAGLFMAA